MPPVIDRAETSADELPRPQNRKTARPIFAHWRRQDAPCEGLEGWSATQLLDYQARMHRHTGRRWTEIDVAVKNEIAARCMGAAELSNFIEIREPIWLEPFCWITTKTGQRRARPVWRRWLAILVAIEAAGAMGMREDRHGVASLLGVCQDTVKNYEKEMIAAGTLARVHTWEPAEETTASARVQAENMYRLGPALASPDILAAAREARGGRRHRESARRLVRAARLNRRYL